MAKQNRKAALDRFLTAEGMIEVALHIANNTPEEDQDGVQCESCGGEGVVGHDCGDDTCCCLDPIENVRCDTCNGEGSWKRKEVNR